MNGNPRNAGVYLRKLQYEIPYASSSAIGNRYVAQDLMLSATMQMQDKISSIKQNAGAAESTIWSRYGLAYKQWSDFITGFPEYLK